MDARKINSTTLIVGAGPAGLAMAGQLAHRKLPFIVLEASEYVGMAWRNHYDRLHLHTVKKHSALPYFPFPSNYPTYVPRLKMVDYLEQYAQHFGITPQFNQPVLAIRRLEDGQWQVETPANQFEVGQVVVATGYNRVPNQPHLPGLSTFRGIIWHSSEYRNGSAFRGENVLVVGMGNTGAEIALDLYEHGARPVISIRGPVNVIKRETFGRPTQPIAIFLNRFPNWFYDFVAGLSQRITVGDLSPYGLAKPPYPPSYQIRKFGKIPVIDIGTLDQIKAGTIQVAPGIQQINRDTVTFTDGRELPFDAIVLATGFRPGLQALLGEPLSRQVLNEAGFPQSSWFKAADLRGLYFLGFRNPITGLLRSITLDSEQIIRHIESTRH